MSKPSFSWSVRDSRLAPITSKAPADALILIREQLCELAAFPLWAVTSLVSVLDVRDCERRTFLPYSFEYMCIGMTL